MSETDSNTICLIDADSLIYFEATQDKTFEEAQQGLLQRLSFILHRCNTTKYAGFITEGKCFRYDVSKEYKAKRGKKGSRPILLPSLQEYSRQILGFIGLRGVEADDLVTFWARQTKDAVISAIDKDVLYQTPGTHYNYKTNEFITVSNLEAREYLWRQALAGDSIDNIPGIRGIGDVKAKSLLAEGGSYEQTVLKEYIDREGSINGIHKFYETFNLVYMLKTKEDFQRWMGIDEPPLQVMDLADVVDQNSVSDSEC